jgi:hypothetical protein
VVGDIDEMVLDYLLVADAAQVSGGKLFMIGGGWDRLLVSRLPGPPALPFFVAFGIGVPWSHTNRRFGFVVDLLGEDEQQIDQLVTGEFEVIRPPGVSPGTRQRAQFAGPARPAFPAAGRYTIRLSVDGTALGETSVEVQSHQS